MMILVLFEVKSDQHSKVSEINNFIIIINMIKEIKSYLF